MPLPDYMAWQRYDAVEPLSVAVALDRLFARLLKMTAKDQTYDVDEWMTFDLLPFDERSRRAAARFKSKFSKH